MNYSYGIIFLLAQSALAYTIETPCYALKDTPEFIQDKKIHPIGKI